MPSQTWSLCCWLLEVTEVVFRSRSLDSFSTTLLIRLSIFCERDNRRSSRCWWPWLLLTTSDLNWARYLGSLKWWWPRGRDILHEASKYSTAKKKSYIMGSQLKSLRKNWIENITSKKSRPKKPSWNQIPKSISQNYFEKFSIKIKILLSEDGKYTKIFFREIDSFHLASLLAWTFLTNFLPTLFIYLPISLMSFS